MNKFISAHVQNKIYLWFVGIILTWFITTFLILPNINILYTTFFADGAFSLEPFQKLLSSERAMKSLFNSFLLGITLVVTVNIVGVFIVLVTDYFDIKGSKILRLGYFTTMIYGGLILVAGYQFIYGNTGFLTTFLVKIFPAMNPDWFIGYPAVVFVMTFSCTTNHIIFLSNAIRSIDYQTVEAARNMGASTWEIVTKIVLPVLRPVLATLSVLLFATGFGAMSAPLIVGGKNFETISPMILTFANSMSSRDLAALLAIFLGVAQIVLLYIITRNEKKGHYISVSKVKTKIVKQKINNKAANMIVHFFAYVLFAIYVLPILAVIIFSFTDTYSISTGTLSWEHFTLENYIKILSDASAYEPFVISIIYSGLAAIIVVAAMLFIARLIHKHNNKLTTTLEYLFHIPWLIPGILMALGLIITFDKPMPIIGNIVLTGTLSILLIAYVIEKIPFTLRILKAAYYSFDSSLEDAAKNLGAGPFYTLIRVILPIVLPSTLAILALNFNSLLADYDLTVFLYHPLYQPLGIVIRNNTDPTASIDAKAMNFVYSVILMVISTIVIYLVYGRGSKKNIL
ncbi:iron ABC transporter permease [Bacillus sp. FJAT-49705]|uniref:Iron ABC transporter permease n=1 Tax=Cytobacillus citreus TaxID=2833586 RepID=A0ABS5NVW4_9BACI|nr:iron ABC transporter permease [Cytobacillus citreus]MBS4191967.1 iron ABC transporter permease [Cytobacillus citreus]